jgi:hypothetical protein
MHTAVVAWAEWVAWAIWECNSLTHFPFPHLPPLRAGEGWGGGAVRVLSKTPSIERLAGFLFLKRWNLA